jgi:hypothetical protein
VFCLSQLQWERASSRRGGFNPIGETLVLIRNGVKGCMDGGQESVCICSVMFVLVFMLRRRDIAAVITSSCRDLVFCRFVKRGKAVPLQAWGGPEGSRKLRFPDYMTRAQGGGKVVSLTHRPPLPPENAPGTHFC